MFLVDKVLAVICRVLYVVTWKYVHIYIYTSIIDEFSSYKQNTSRTNDMLLPQWAHRSEIRCRRVFSPTKGSPASCNSHKPYLWEMLLATHSLRIHVWYIHLHLVDFYGKCSEIYHTWILWDWKSQNNYFPIPQRFLFSVNLTVFFFTFVVGGFKPSWKILVTWIISPGGGDQKENIWNHHTTQLFWSLLSNITQHSSKQWHESNLASRH